MVAVVCKRLSQTTLVMSRIQNTRISRSLIISSAFAVFLVLSVAGWANYFRVNIGFVMVNQALATQSKHRSILKAVEWFERAGVASAGRGLGFALSTLGHEEQARAAWKQAGEDEGDFLIRGKGARELGDYEMAITWFERAIVANSNFADAWYELGLSYELLGDSEKAIATYEQGLTKTEFVQVGPSDIYQRLGFVYARLVDDVDLETALNYYDQALLKNNFGSIQDEARTHYFKAEALRQSNQITEAIAEYELVIAQQPKNYWAHVRLGFLIWNTQQNAGAAETLFLQALALDDQQKVAYHGLGVVYKETGRNTEAIQIYQKLLALDPTDTNAQEALATLEQ
jgi:tetratricopeptide (TPR) repeat protein